MNAIPKSVPFSGIWPALLTPLRADLSLDPARLVAHARRLIDAGCSGVTPFGTTGEGPAFGVDERRAALEALVAGGVPAGRILASTSCAALPETVALTRHALDLGVQRCMVLPPFYLKGVPDQGIVDSYRYVIDRVADARLRLVLYHIPQVTAVGLSHGVIGTLRRLYPDTIVAIKDSQCDQAHSVGLAKAFMPGLMVWVGNELDLPAMARLGSSGAVSGVANFMPRTVAALVGEPDSPRTAERLARVRALLEIVGGYAMTPAFKGIMSIVDGDEGWLPVRPPLVPLDGAQLTRLKQQMTAFGFDPERD
jgi:4-hydroxy-tetrahydrodipicolinate synthase